MEMGKTQDMSKNKDKEKLPDLLLLRIKSNLTRTCE